MNKSQNHHQTSQSYSPAARSFVQKFISLCDVIFMFENTIKHKYSWNKY